MKLNNLATIHMYFIFCSIYLQFLVNFTGLRKRHPLKIMADLKRANLLSHPLTTSLLDKKWWKSIWLYFTVFLIYAIYITFLTGYMLVNEPPFSFKRYAFVTTLNFLLFWVCSFVKFNFHFTLSPCKSNKTL